MKCKFRIINIIVIILFIISIFFCFRINAILSKMEKYQSNIDLINEYSLDINKVARVVNFYKNYYVGELDVDKDVTNIVINTLISEFNDKYGLYVSGEDDFTLQKIIDGEYQGIGVIISYPENENYVLVEDVLNGQPADRAGIKKGDKIFKINNIDIRSDEGLEIFTNMYLLDKKDILLNVNNKDIRVYLDKIVIETVHIDVKEDIAITTIDSFNKNTDEEFIEEFNNVLENNNINYLIFDVRDNSGGEKEAVTRIIDRLAPEGEIYTEEFRNNSDIFKSDAECVNIPIIILGNSESASASELFIMSLQDTNNALFIGEKTYGKSTIISLFPIGGTSTLVMSTGYYYPPSDRFIEGIGIQPDIEEFNDPLKVALEYIDDLKTQ